MSKSKKNDQKEPILKENYFLEIQTSSLERISS